MDLLPDELILLIVNRIENLNDKRKFSMTCKKYLNITKTIISNIKYVVSSNYGCRTCGNKQFLKGVFDNLDYCRKYIKKSLGENEINYPSTIKMNKRNNYIVNVSRYKYCNGPNRYECNYDFLIEEIMSNNFDL